MDRTIYYRFADGSVAEKVVTVPAEDTVVTPPEGATEITKEQYDTELAAIEAANAAALAETQAADRARQREDYEALLAAGIPEATARRMSGYEPDPEVP